MTNIENISRKTWGKLRVITKQTLFGLGRQSIIGEINHDKPTAKPATPMATASTPNTTGMSKVS